MKIRISIIFLLVLPSFLFAQNVDLKYSKPKFTKLANLISGSLDNEGNLQLLKQEKRHVYKVETYDVHTLELKAEHNINVRDSDVSGLAQDAFTPHNLVNLNGVNVMILSALDKKEQRQHVTLQSINAKGEYVGKMVQLGSFKTSEIHMVRNLTISISEDHSCLAVTSPYIGPNLNAYSMDAIVYMGDNHQISYFTLETPFTYRWSKAGKITLSNNGQLIIPVSEEKNSDFRPSKLSEKSLKIFMSQKKGLRFESLDLYPKGQVFTSIDYALTPSQDYIECWGMYGNMDDKYGSDQSIGLFMLSIDLNKGVVVRDVRKLFSDELVALVNEKKAARVKDDEGIEHPFNLSHILYRNNERWLVFEEINFKTSQTFMPAYGTYLDLHHYAFSTVLLLKTDLSCAVDKQVRLLKNQITIDDNGLYSSFLLKDAGDKIVMYYNDEKRNTEIKSRLRKVNPMSDPKKAALYKAVVDSEGILSKTLVKENFSDKHMLVLMSDLGDTKKAHFGIYTNNVFNEKSEGVGLGLYRLAD